MTKGTVIVADKDAELIKTAAEAMGMKAREVLEVVEVEDGYVARTHDGRWTFLDSDWTVGELLPQGYSPTPVKRVAATKRA